MSNKSVVRVDFGTLLFRSDDVWSELRLLLEAEADLSITIAGREWLRDPLFPVIRLAAAVHSWLREGGDLVFDTGQTDEASFLWVRQVGARCLLGAARQTFRIEDPICYIEVRRAFSAFATQVVVAANNDLGIDIEPVLRRWSA